MVKISVVGGGQLARMMIPAAINLGVDLEVFSETENSPASIATTRVGDYTSLGELSAFSRGTGVLTFDHEHVPLKILEALELRGLRVHPPPKALALVHNKIVMRNALASMGLPMPRWREVTNESELPAAVESVGGLPCIAKLPVGGYDGKGVRVVTELNEVNEWISKGSVLIEEKVEFVRELSQLGARNASGDWAAWPAVETRQTQGVCSEVIAPAMGFTAEQSAHADALARRIAEEIGVIGVLAVELFEDSKGNLLINELAMRPHNSGHVFTELSITSQFEQHLRAVSNMPLGSTALVAPAGVMVNIFGGVDEVLALKARAHFPEAKIHDYRKQSRVGRKAGHVVVIGPEYASLLAAGQAVRDILNQDQ